MTLLHPREQLHERLDGRLDPERSAALDLHLRDCAACRAELAALRKTKEALRLLAEEPAPVLRVPRTRRTAVALAAAVLLVGLAAAWFFLHSGARDLPAELETEWQGLADPELLEVVSSDAATLDRFFLDRGLPFPARVFDLAMMGWRLQGARLVTIDGRATAVWTYRAADGRRLACFMRRGRLDALPAPEERIEHGGRPFFIYTRQGRTVVFWPEGNVLCALVGEGRTEVIELAKAKAMGPA